MRLFDNFPLLFKYFFKNTKEQYILYLKTIYDNVTLSRHDIIYEDDPNDPDYIDEEYRIRRTSYQEPYEDFPYHQVDISIEKYLEIYLEILYKNLNNDKQIEYYVDTMPREETYIKYRRTFFAI